MNVSAWCSRVIRVSFYLLFILVPLFLTPWNYELFEYNKMVVTYGLTMIIFGAWLIKMLSDREVRIAKTPLDIPIALFVASQLVSTLFSMDPHVSWFGYYSRFNGGMWSIFSYVVLYYAFVTHFPPVKKTLNVILATAALVALYGVAQHFGIDKHVWVQDVQSRVFSTLGQPNWFAAFLAALIPISLYLVVFNQPTIKNGKPHATAMQVIKHLFGGITTILFFLVILYTRSRSGLLGFAVADLLFWTLLYLSAKKKKPVVIPFVAIHVIFAIIVFVNGVYVDQIDRWVTFNGWKNRITHVVTPTPVVEKTPSGTLLESGGTESGTIRKYVWQAAITAWRANTKNMAIGTGTETFAFTFYQYRPQGHNMTSEWDFLYNKAHNEYLNYLATTGLFGLGAYLLLIGSFIFWYIKFLISNFQFSIKISNFKFQIGKTSEHDGNLLITSAALFSGWLSILVTNFFGFSVVVMQLFFFLFPAVTIALAANMNVRVFPLRLTQRMYQIFSLTILLSLLFLLVLLFRYWQADTFFSTGYRSARANQFAQAEIFDTKAISLNPGEPMYHDELATTLASLTLAAIDAKNATLAASLAKQSLAQSDIAIRTSPKNVNFWKTRTKLYYSFSTFDPQLNQAAISALEMAQTLSPNDPKIVYNLAILYGRQGDNNRAVQLLGLAKTLKPNYRDAYFGLYVFYTEMKNLTAARAELQYYLNHVDPNDKDFQSRLTP
jgi:tetratricopeptide (TPR) repeat protein